MKSAIPVSVHSFMILYQFLALELWVPGGVLVQIQVPTEYLKRICLLSLLLQRRL